MVAWMSRRKGPRGTVCQWFDMPPFLLLFSKKLLARRLPDVFELTDAGGLRLRGRVNEPPWLHYKRARKLGEPCGRNKESYVCHLDLQKPWWHCLSCWQYWQRNPADQASFVSDERVPMRNQMEGHFTRWHTDIAYPHLYAAFLREKYPRAPHPDVVLEWRQEREQILQDTERHTFNDSPPGIRK